MFIPSSGNSAASLSDNDVGHALAIAVRKGREVGGATLSMADAVAADFLQGMRESAGVRKGTTESKVLRDQLLHGLGRRPMADAIWKPMADAASTVPEAGTFVAGAPVGPLIRPNMLLDQLPGFAVPTWTDTVRYDYYDLTGQVQWGRGGDTSFPQSGYTVTSEFTSTPEIVWTATNIHYRQEMMAQSPNYAIDPFQKNAEAAKFSMDLALENALVTTPAGLGFAALHNTPALVGASSLTYGTDAIESCLVDFTKFLQTVKELSLNLLNPDTLVTTQRVLNGLFRPVTTSTGYPFSPSELLMARVKEYGITKIIIAPSLQDYGGTNIDVAIVIDSGPMGLKQITALPFTAVRTSINGLNTQTIFAAVVAGLYARYRASTYIYEIAVTPVA
jgi:hypothetical protein